MSISSDLHRRRRKPLEPFFSRLGVIRIEPTLGVLVQKLVQRIESFRGTNVIVRLDHAFTALTGDVIAQICYEGKEGFLDDSYFTPQ